MNNIQGQRGDDWGYFVRCNDDFVASLSRTREKFANKRTPQELTITRQSENPLPRVGLTHYFFLPEVSLNFESAGSNQGPNHILIPRYQVKPLTHAGILCQLS